MAKRKPAAVATEKPVTDVFVRNAGEGSSYHSHTDKPTKIDYGYTFRKALYLNDDQFVKALRDQVTKLADMLNTAREKGLDVNFSIRPVEGHKHMVPVVQIKKEM